MSDIQDTTATPDDWTARVGGLLGGPRDDTVMPFIGQQGLSNARNNALLNFGIGLMQAGGWHPYHVTMGQALAQGLQGAQQAYQGSLDAGMKGAMTSTQLFNARLGMLMNTAKIRQAMSDPDIAPAFAGLPIPGGIPGGIPGASTGTTPTPADATSAVTTPVSLAQPTATPLDAAPAGMQAPGGAGVPLPMPSQGQAPGAPMAAPQTGLAAISPDRLAQIKRAYARLKFAGLFEPDTARGTAAAEAPFLPDIKEGANGDLYDARDLNNIGRNFTKLLDGRAVMTPTGVQLRPGVPAAETTLANIPARAKAQYDYGVKGVVTSGPQAGMPYVTTPVQAQEGSGPPPLPPSLAGGPQAAPQGMPAGGPAPMQAPPQGAPMAAPQGAPMAAPAGLPPGAIPTGQSPLDATLTKGGAENLQKELTASAAAVKDAPNQLQILARNDQLLRQTKADSGAPAALAVGKYLQAAGILSPKDSQDIDKITELYNNESNAVLAQLKATFPGRITNADLNFATSTMAGKGQSPTAARVLNGINAVKILTAQDYARFVSNYATQAKAGQVDANGLGEAWQAHEMAQPSIWETPLLLNSGALTTKTNAKGATFVSIPGRGWLPVTRTQSGMLAPANQ